MLLLNYENVVCQKKTIIPRATYCWVACFLWLEVQNPKIFRLLHFTAPKEAANPHISKVEPKLWFCCSINVWHDKSLHQYYNWTHTNSWFTKLSQLATFLSTFVFSSEDMQKVFFVLHKSSLNFLSYDCWLNQRQYVIASILALGSLSGQSDGFQPKYYMIMQKQTIVAHQSFHTLIHMFNKEHFDQCNYTTTVSALGHNNEVKLRDSANNKNRSHLHTHKEGEYTSVTFYQKTWTNNDIIQ